MWVCLRGVLVPCWYILYTVLFYVLLCRTIQYCIVLHSRVVALCRGGSLLAKGILRWKSQWGAPPPTNPPNNAKHSWNDWIGLSWIPEASRGFLQNSFNFEFFRLFLFQQSCSNERKSEYLQTMRQMKIWDRAVKELIESEPELLKLSSFIDVIDASLTFPHADFIHMNDKWYSQLGEWFTTLM